MAIACRYRFGDGLGHNNKNTMNTTGKAARKASGLNRYEIHFNEHANKSDAKRRASGWGKKGQRQAMKDGRFSKVAQP